MQPLGNRRVLQRVAELSGSGAAEKEAGTQAWQQRFIGGGLAGKLCDRMPGRHWSATACATPATVGLEALLGRSAGRFCVGDEVTMADALLVPQVRRVERHVACRRVECRCPGWAGLAGGQRAAVRARPGALPHRRTRQRGAARAARAPAGGSSGATGRHSTPQHLNLSRLLSIETQVVSIHPEYLYVLLSGEQLDGSHHGIGRYHTNLTNLKGPVWGGQPELAREMCALS